MRFRWGSAIHYSCGSLEVTCPSLYPVLVLEVRGQCGGIVLPLFCCNQPAGLGCPGSSVPIALLRFSGKVEISY